VVNQAVYEVHGCITLTQLAKKPAIFYPVPMHVRRNCLESSVLKVNFESFFWQRVNIRYRISFNWQIKGVRSIQMISHYPWQNVEGIISDCSNLPFLPFFVCCLKGDYRAHPKIFNCFALSLESKHGLLRTACDGASEQDYGYGR